MGGGHPIMKNVEGADRQQLRRILLELLSLSQFDRVIDSLNRDRETIALGDDKEEIFFKVITEANRARWLADLVEAARELRPHDPALYEFASVHFGLGIRGSPSRAAFERIVIPAHRFLQFGNWNARASAIERQVCRIRMPVPGGIGFGTGFLVGPAAVLTNYHVIEPILDKQTTPEQVDVELDYKVIGSTPHPGRVVKLAADWLIDSSPYAASDSEVTSADLPTGEELDYALLRLAEPVGQQSIGKIDDPKAEPRGWIDLTKAAANDPDIGAPVLIVQHPKGDPLALAMEMKGVLSINKNSTRIRYATNTEPGSSGSPVFDIDWNLIALHHFGDADYSEFHAPEYNQGVVIRRIAELLEKREKLPSQGH
jgi:hypothetical protein